MAFKLKFRKFILPRVPSNIGACVFLLAMIPATYWFELFVVLPTVHSPWSLWYIIHFTTGTFLMINVTSNFVAAVTVDTSIKGEIMPSSMEPGWRFCSVCETVTPPRSWHCSVCKTCILKRDHHCIFTGCCIGHYNHRYFFMFCVYMAISTLYGTYFNVSFVYNNVDFQSPLTILKLFFPMAVLIFGIDGSLGQFYLMVILINFVGFGFVFALMCIHADLISRGQSQYEKNHHIRDYDFGLKCNIRNAFGNRWYIAWLFPFIQSDLPHDGIHWKTNSSQTETIKMK